MGGPESIHRSSSDSSDKLASNSNTYVTYKGNKSIKIL